ncbi:excalibur calcium-binding domain-containing protein [Sphingomonas sp. C3-2]|uniref:excalibur calcium-binding domain-containing protein n=1 Tax=Sphingomonas sp. C3-2 TaxID=3062169 RepID=UPI00294ABA42|nr:excalibur calcium-binding domain-containing protein [Sphingomonas sp. C3-2]WOK37576.1 excalibur calcium-binding domain-containing protein [Sphingomonas sp. C3-2]
MAGLSMKSVSSKGKADKKPLIFHCYAMFMQRHHYNSRRRPNGPRRYQRRKPSKGSFGAQVLGLSLFAGVAAWQGAPMVESLWSNLSKTPEEIAAIEQSAYYAGCDDARAAGVAPIYRGQPGYREGMDGDGDGIACEPYR